VVYRHPNESSDFNCYLATNCGTFACAAGQSIYQDVDVAGLGPRRMAFGGKLAHDAGQPDGGIDVVVHQLDAAAALLATDQIPITATSAWFPVWREFHLDARTTTLRFQLYLHEAATTYKADELFVVPLAP
jgi:hypothetical protein